MSAERRSLVIGASGQVGHQILSLLGPSRTIAAGRRVGAPDCVALDLACLPDNAEWLLEALAIDAIYCVAGMTDVERCQSEPKLAVRVNCEGPAALAAWAARIGVPFIYFSTEYIFNGKDGPYAEEAAGDPICVYGKSKWLGELAVREAHPNALIVRTTVVYGPDPGEKNFLYSLRRALAARKPFAVPCDQISTPTYNRDLANAVIGLVHGRARGVFHVCGPERLSRLEFARRAAEAMRLDPAGIIGVPTPGLGQRAPRPLSAGLSTEKLARLRPDLKMRGVEESIRDWAAGEALPC